MKRATDAVRLITAILLGISAGISLAHNVRALVRDEEAAVTKERA
ncbi:hypothetical protein [Saccharopolyspora phatthalungensis]|uniref:Uncharacterized protein n=1 Tax=Saccharopolyspora phatthalungensis TaxID=664693 RepID=A0A840Q5L8_9PSEU|nr:hypothetical protein [Saccharopolyspora phatthalungensis]MBB5154991.1 hypothetical protein [Saccharopolyspora phatthalungensis]